MVVGGVANESQRKQKVMNGMRATLSLLVGAAIAMTTSVAYAQDIGGSSAPASGGSSGGSITDTSGPTDHSQVVGHLALRYFGSTTMAVLGVAEPPGFDTASRAAGQSLGEISSPTIPDLPPGVMRFVLPGAGKATLHTVGARYWLSNNLGIEGGLSIGFSSGSSSVTAPTTSGNGTSTFAVDVPNFFGIGFQFGMPIMLAEAKHLSVHLTPTLSLAYATSSITTGNNDTAADNSGRSIQFNLGANASAELQFGFIGIPQLALQAQVGVYVRYTSATLETVPRRSGLTNSVSQNVFGLGTTVGPNYSLGDILGGAISVIYYFGNAPGTQR